MLNTEQMELFPDEASPDPAREYRTVGAVADRQAAEVVCGRPLPKELFEPSWWGRLVLVVREETEKMIGSIVLPETSQDRNPKSLGWVISAGPLVGSWEPGLKNQCPFGPDEILLRKVMFGRYSGIGVPVVTEDGRIRLPTSP